MMQKNVHSPDFMNSATPSKVQFERTGGLGESDTFCKAFPKFSEIDRVSFVSYFLVKSLLLSNRFPVSKRRDEKPFFNWCSAQKGKR